MKFGCCWAIAGYDHRFCVFVDICCIEIGGVDELVYIYFWWLVLYLCVVLFLILVSVFGRVC